MKPFIHLLILTLISCSSNDRHVAEKNIKSSIGKNVADTNIKSRFTHSSLDSFLVSLIDTKNIRIDNSWKQNIDTGEYGDYAWFGLGDFGDFPQDTLDFPFTDIKFQFYRAGYFKFNTHIFQVADNPASNNPKFDLYNLRKFKYRNNTFLIFKGGPKEYNGSGSRSTYHYFFLLSDKKPIQEIHENMCGCIGESPLYGDLNNDHYLDRLVHEGINIFAETEIYDMVLKAESFINGKWVPLRDKNNKAYFIKLGTNYQMDSCTVIEANWPKEIK